MNLSDCVYLLGAKTNVNEYMQAMDCFLFPSKWEGLPVTVVEAQASGLRCFVSNTVTKEVCISDLVTYLPIDKGIDIWVNEISKENFEKKCVTQEIINAGFSINESVNVLTSFYLNIINY